MPEIPDRESLEGAAIGNPTSLETTPRDNFRNGFEAGYEAALAAREEQSTLARERLNAVNQTLTEHGAPTHDENGAKLNANGRLVDFLATRDNELGLLRANREALIRRITGLEEFAREVAAREEPEDPNPTGEACCANSSLFGPCDRGVGHPGDHHDVAGNEWAAAREDTERPDGRAVCKLCNGKGHRKVAGAPYSEPCGCENGTVPAREEQPLESWAADE